MTFNPSNFQPSSDTLTLAQRVVELREFRLRWLIELIGQLGPELWDLLRGINIGELSGLLTAIREFRAIPGEWTDQPAVKARTLAALNIFSAFCKITPTDRDDQLADAASNWVRAHEAVLDFVAGLIAEGLKKWIKVRALGEGKDQGRLLTASEIFGELTLDVRMAEADATVKAMAVDWVFVMELARQLFEIIMALLQSRK